MSRDNLYLGFAQEIRINIVNCFKSAIDIGALNVDVLLKNFDQLLYIISFVEQDVRPVVGDYSAKVYSEFYKYIYGILDNDLTVVEKQQLFDLVVTFSGENNPVSFAKFMNDKLARQVFAKEVMFADNVSSTVNFIQADADSLAINGLQSPMGVGSYGTAADFYQGNFSTIDSINIELDFKDNFSKNSIINIKEIMLLMQAGVRTVEVYNILYRERPFVLNLADFGLVFSPDQISDSVKQGLLARCFANIKKFGEIDVRFINCINKLQEDEEMPKYSFQDALLLNLYIGENPISKALFAVNFGLNADVNFNSSNLKYKLNLPANTIIDASIVEQLVAAEVNSVEVIYNGQIGNLGVNRNGALSLKLAHEFDYALVDLMELMRADCKLLSELKSNPMANISIKNKGEVLALEDYYLLKSFDKSVMLNDCRKYTASFLDQGDSFIALNAYVDELVNVWLNANVSSVVDNNIDPVVVLGNIYLDLQSQKSIVEAELQCVKDRLNLNQELLAELACKSALDQVLQLQRINSDAEHKQSLTKMLKVLQDVDFIMVKLERWSVFSRLKQGDAMFESGLGFLPNNYLRKVYMTSKSRVVVIDLVTTAISQAHRRVDHQNQVVVLDGGSEFQLGVDQHSSQAVNDGWRIFSTPNYVMSFPQAAGLVEGEVAANIIIHPIYGMQGNLAKLPEHVGVHILSFLTGDKYIDLVCKPLGLDNNSQVNLSGLNTEKDVAMLAAKKRADRGFAREDIKQDLALQANKKLPYVGHLGVWKGFKQACAAKFAVLLDVVVLGMIMLAATSLLQLPLMALSIVAVPVVLLALAVIYNGYMVNNDKLKSQDLTINHANPQVGDNIVSAQASVFRSALSKDPVKDVLSKTVDKNLFGKTVDPYIVTKVTT